MCGLARRQSSFPPGTFAPYQVRLDNGKLIYAPIDEDRVCRAYVGEEAPSGVFLAALKERFNVGRMSDLKKTPEVYPQVVALAQEVLS